VLENEWWVEAAKEKWGKRGTMEMSISWGWGAHGRRKEGVFLDWRWTLWRRTWSTYSRREGGELLERRWTSWRRPWSVPVAWRDIVISHEVFFEVGEVVWDHVAVPRGRGLLFGWWAADVEEGQGNAS